MHLLTQTSFHVTHEVNISVPLFHPTSLHHSPAASPHAIFNPGSRVILDFGVEMPAWLEFDSPDLQKPDGVVMGVGEYAAPWQTGPSPHAHKTGSPRQYNRTFRLETNPQLYEGVRCARQQRGISHDALVDAHHITSVHSTTHSLNIPHTLTQTTHVIRARTRAWYPLAHHYTAHT